MKKLMKELVIGTVICTVALLGLRFAFHAGAKWAVEEVGEIYAEGLRSSIGSLEVNEISTEYTLQGEIIGDGYEDIKYVVIRTK